MCSLCRTRRGDSERGLVPGHAPVLQKAPELPERPRPSCPTELDLHIHSFCPSCAHLLVLTSSSRKLQYLQVTEGHRVGFRRLFWTRIPPQQQGTLVLQQDLSNTALAPAVLELGFARWAQHVHKTGLG